MLQSSRAQPDQVEKREVAGHVWAGHVCGKWEGMGTLSRTDLSPLMRKPLRMFQLYLEKERKPGASHLI